jgi:NTE family protein
MRFKIKVVFVFLLFFGALSAQDRPIVGVVLSGGGAKGFAHVGMLKVIDSLGIPVDYVAGTSMGSVVGSLYALGYNPHQIEEIVTDIDWTSLMSDAPEREYLTHLNKSNFEKYLFKTNLQGLGIVPPSGFISGQKMIAKLNEVTQNYHGERDFLTDFPRKFLCVATDLRTGEETVFTHGSLPDAIRASVSIPSMFTPYRVDGELKVDGGMVNNFPSDHLKALGCDIIIGLSVQSPVQDSLGQISIIEVLEMMGMFIDTKSNDYRQSLCDVVIHPDMQGYGLTDFESNEAIVEIGEIGANEKMDELVRIANQFKRYPKQEIAEYVPKDSVHISEITIDGLKRKSGVNILDKFGVEENETYAIEDLEYQLNVVYGSQRFKQVQYKLLEKDDGTFLMRIEVVEKESDTQVGINLHYDSDFGAAVGLGLIHYDAFIDGADLGIDLLLRNNIMARLYYDYDRGKYPGFYFESRYFNALPSVYDNKKFIGELGVNDWSNYLALQSSYKRRGNVKIGIGLDFQKYNFDRIPDWIDDPSSGIDYSRLGLIHVHWAKVQIDIDNLDSKDFATKGFRLYAQGSLTQLLKESFGAFNFEPFAPLSIDYVQAWSPKKWLTILPRGRAGVTLANESTLPYKFFTGSFGRNNIQNNRNFPGYRFMELTVREDGVDYYPENIASAECAVRFQIGKFGYLSAMGGFGSASHELDRMFQSYFGGIGASYSINTIFGPVQMVVHKSTDHKAVYTYLSFGYWL